MFDAAHDPPGLNAGHPEGGRVASLLMKHRTHLNAYLLAAVRSTHDAEDLLQEVSLIAIQNAAKYRPETNFRAWIREIARICLMR